MGGPRNGWMLGILALALWAGVPYAAGQKQSGKRSDNGPQHRAGQHAAAKAQQASSPKVSSSEAETTPRSVPESGAPSLENHHPTATLQTLPNQTLTPGATTVPSNAGGIAPASNDASSGEYTPSEGQTAPTTPGGNPSQTQGVPTFSSAAQPANANLPRTVHPAARSTNPAAGSARADKPRNPPKTGNH